MPTISDDRKPLGSGWSSKKARLSAKKAKVESSDAKPGDMKPFCVNQYVPKLNIG